MDHWTAGMDYTGMDYWNGLLEHACHKFFEVSMTIVHMHALLKRKGYFNNGSVTGVASLSFYAAQYLSGNNVLLIVIPYMAIIVWI